VRFGARRNQTPAQQATAQRDVARERVGEVDVNTRGCGHAFLVARGKYAEARLQAGGRQEFPDDAEAADQAAARHLLARALRRRAGGELELGKAQAAERLDAEGLALAEKVPEAVGHLEEAEVELVMQLARIEHAAAEHRRAVAGAEALRVLARGAGQAQLDAMPAVRHCRSLAGGELTSDVEAQAQRGHED